MDHILPGRTQSDVLYELLLKSGMPLTAPIAEISVGGQTVHKIGGGELLICLADPIGEETLSGMAALKPRRVLCLDHAFGGNDSLKTNALLQMKNDNIEFHTV